MKGTLICAMLLGVQKRNSKNLMSICQASIDRPRRKLIESKGVLNMAPCLELNSASSLARIEPGPIS